MSIGLKDSKGKSFNPYVDGLAQFNGLAFANKDAHALRGKWAEFFKERLLRLPGESASRLVLEIGCSSGGFLNRIATENPRLIFIGLDWKYKLIYKACEKTNKLSLKNTAFVRSRAQDLSLIFGDSELDEVWYFFPDPWPKAAQHKHRLFQDPFLKDLSRVLKPGGYVHVKTDHPGYFEWMMAVCGETTVAPALPLHPLDGNGVSASYTRRGRQMQHRAFGNKELPDQSPHAEEFHMVYRTMNFWSEKPELSKLWTKGLPLWWNHTTLFEALFLRDALPVYAFSLQKKL